MAWRNIEVCMVGFAALAACHFDTGAAAYQQVGEPDGGPDGGDATPGDAPSDGGPDGLPDGSMGQAPTDCPPGFVAIAGAPVTSKYHVSANDDDWTSARYTCSDMAPEGAVARTHLVALESAAEYDAIAPLFGNESQQLGLSRFPASPWMWVTGTAAEEQTLPWAPDEPDPTKNCAAIVSMDGPQGMGDVMRLRAVSCLSGAKRNFVCECENGVGDALLGN